MRKDDRAKRGVPCRPLPRKGQGARRRRRPPESGCSGMQPQAGGKPHPRLNTGERPIANKYREGKMKRTLRRESKALEIAGREALGARRSGPSGRPVAGGRASKTRSRRFCRCRGGRRGGSLGRARERLQHGPPRPSPRHPARSEGTVGVGSVGAAGGRGFFFRAGRTGGGGSPLPSFAAGRSRRPSPPGPRRRGPAPPTPRSSRDGEGAGGKGVPAASVAGGGRETRRPSVRGCPGRPPSLEGSGTPARRPRAARLEKKKKKRKNVFETNSSTKAGIFYF